MRKSAIAVFVKTPSLSPIKTRLASSIGRKAAEEFYLLSVAALKSTIESLTSANNNITPIWAVAENEGLSHSLWEGWETISQGEGDLGTKLHNVFRKLILEFESVVIIGSDSPQLTANNLECAFRSLENTKVPERPTIVIGPCEDGGFYLVGSSGQLPEDLWMEIRYSTELAGRDLAEAALRLGDVINLPVEIDVDTSSDLAAIKKLLEMRSSAPKTNRSLLDWLNSKVRFS